MKIHKFIFILTTALLLFFSGCSSNEHLLITKNSSTSTDNTLVIMGIEWEEIRFDITEETTKKVTSKSLIEDKELVKSKKHPDKENILHHPLHHLSHFNFNFEDNEGNNHYFTRFGKDLQQYEPFAIYQFKPGQLNFTSIKTRHALLKEEKDNVEFHRRVDTEHTEDFGSWSFSAGKIIYLGNIKLFYYTKHREYGLFNQEDVNVNVSLAKVIFEDKYTEMTKYLQQKKPWFPSTDIINMSFNKEWEYLKIEIPDKPSNLETETEKSKKTKAFF